MGNRLYDLHDLQEDEVQDYPDDESYDSDESRAESYGQLVWPGDSRWRPLTAVLGAVVALGAIATAVVINSGDSASTKATVGAPAPRPMTSAPATPRTTVPPGQWTQPRLPPETFTTVPPAARPPSAAPAPTATATPTAAPPPLAPGATTAPRTAVNPRTVVYSVTGTKGLLDLVNVVYTDARGFPQTEFNVALPWSKMIVLNPGVATESVIATSLSGRLSCSIINAEGQPVVSSANTAIMATCTR
ncbi:MmpS family transport accessory protein [Mycobacterium sp. Lab-001]|uniref:MmpS family transport accessory protein n=1 Tax=Mycobacterium sp. Lab-001 TaxID=3410136 RepID=UPI003D178757